MMKFKLNFLVNKKWLPFDVSAILTIVGLSVALGVVFWKGDRNFPRVTQWSWEESRLGVQDQAVSLTFDRPMDWETVIDHLEIDPPLEGKFSWVGRKLFYTLTDLPVYGTEYEITIDGAKAEPTSRQYTPKLLEDFEITLPTRDRAFTYLGVEGEESGRLILYNVTESKKITLTPPDLVVTQFEPYPEGDRVLFSAYERQGTEGQETQQLYTVTTGFNYQPTDDPPPYGRIEQVLDATNYQNFQFELSEDGNLIVLQRVNRQDPVDTGLWVVPQGGEPRPLGLQGNEFKITPDGQTLVISQNGGVSLIPLTKQSRPREFFPGYTKAIAVSQNDPKHIIVLREYEDTTRSLFIIDENGEEEELVTVGGFILDCAFEPREEQFLYCLQTEALDPERRTATPFVTIVDLEEGRNIPVVALTNDPDVRMSMSPDGRSILFDQVVLNQEPTSRLERERLPASGQIWLLPLPDLNSPNPEIIPPEKVTIGLDPKWIP